MGTEQRKNERYSPKTTTIAALGKENMKVGIIKDISIAGVCFNVTRDDGSQLEIMPTVDVFVPDNGFRLTQVPCTVIHCNHGVPDNEDSTSFEPFSCSRYGLRFERFTKDQIAQLADFLIIHATEIL